MLEREFSEIMKKSPGNGDGRAHQLAAEAGAAGGAVAAQLARVAAPQVIAPQHRRVHQRLRGGHSSRV